MRRLRLISIAALLSSSVVAQAATVTFNFINADGGAGYQLSKTFTGSDGTSTMLATATNSEAPGLTSWIDSAARGLYVCTGTTMPSGGGSCTPGTDEPHIDGIGPNETVNLDLRGSGSQWRIVGATFHDPSFGGNFDMGADGINVVDEMVVSTTVSFLGNNFVGHQFSFSADDETDYFKLSSVTLQQVPLPGTLGLLGLGLAVLGRVRRKGSN